MTNILTDISTYSLTDHLPFPTLEFIKHATGFDLFLEAGGEVQALGQLRTYTKTAWATLKAQKTFDTAKKLEYLIATNEEYRRAFLDYVASFVSAVYSLGGINFLSPTAESNTILALPLIVRNHLEGSLLKIERLHLVYEYRKGY